MHHKRRRPKSMRAGCCCGGKINKQEWMPKRVKIRGLRVPRKLKEIAVLGVLVALFTVRVSAQTDPLQRPLLNIAAVTSGGSFRLPAGVGLEYGSSAVGVSEDGRYLYVSCAFDNNGIAKLAIPAAGGVATIVEPCAGPGKKEIDAIHPTNPGANPAQYGGVLEIGGRLIASAFIAYDADGGANRTYWSGPNAAGLTGPYSTSGVTNGFLKGAMSVIPPEWRPLLGGYEAMHCDRWSSIVARGSFMPSCTVFHPSDMGKDGIPMRLVFACRVTDPGCATWQATPGRTDRYEGAEHIGAVFIAPGTRTLVAIVREGDGDPCYGYPTTDKALHGTEHPGPDPAKWCYTFESTDTNWGKGPKNWPYRLVAYLYDMQHVVDAYTGKRAIWDVKPYAAPTLPGSHTEQTIWGGNFNYRSGTSYTVQSGGRMGTSNQRLTVDMLTGWGAGSTPPPPTHDRARANGYDDGWQAAWIAAAKATLLAGAPKLAGKVLHIGDSMTYSAAYGAWAREATPAGATADDRAALVWAHAGASGQANGWQLSWQAVTAAGGLAWQSPLIDGLLTDARTRDAQYAVWQLHAPDANPADVSEVRRRVQQFAAAGVVSVLTTVPPRAVAGYDAAVTIPYNAALRALARELQIPIIDLYEEIVLRRPGGTWAGTLISGDGVHLSGTVGSHTPTSDPYATGGDPATHATGAAAAASGYLLRTWLTLSKLAEIRAAIGTVAPVDCVGTWSPWARVAGSESACEEGRRFYRESRTFVVQTPASGGGRACPVSPEVRTLTESCNSGPTLTLSATGSTRTCALVLTANQPPDATPGWGVQFARRLVGDEVWTPHGTRDALQPYVRSATVPLGHYEARAVWSRTGATPVPVPVMATWECLP